MKPRTEAKVPRAPRGDAWVYLLRTCAEGGRAYEGFKWPLRVGAEARPERWDPRPTCGHGLHGLIFGIGNASLLKGDAPIWMVVRALKSEVVDIDGKVKVPRAWVHHVGTRESATALIYKLGNHVHAVAYLTATAGDAGTATAGARGTATAGDAGTATAGARGTATAGARGTATAGYAGTATAGYAGTATAGDAGTATAGDAGTATAGARGTATAGYAGTATAGYAGTATAGYAGTATAGYAGTATAGYAGTATAGARGTATAGYAGTATAGYAGTATAGARGTATAGYAGTATAGDAGTATAGDAGTATAGKDGILVLRWWDEKVERYRLIVGYVGENGIKAETKYKLDDRHELVPA